MKWASQDVRGRVIRCERPGHKNSWSEAGPAAIIAGPILRSLSSLSSVPIKKKGSNKQESFQSNPGFEVVKRDSGSQKIRIFITCIVVLFLRKRPQTIVLQFLNPSPKG